MVSVRTLSIQCQYELRDMEGVLLECTNFSRYLNRDSNMTTEAKQPMKEFIRFIKLLVEAPYRKDITKEKLRKKLNEPKSMRARSWLEEKINKL